MKKKISFWIGISILVFLLVSYFIKFQVDSGSNYTTLDSLLGILIFHNIFVLLLYVLIVVVLIFKSKIKVV